MDYVHVVVYTIGNRVCLSLEIYLLPSNYNQLVCQGHCNKVGCKKLFINNKNNIHCFHCIPWGNWKLSSSYNRIGELVAEMTSATKK